MPLARRLALLGAGTALLVACGSAGASPSNPTATIAPAPGAGTVGTVGGVGVLPSTIAAQRTSDGSATGSAADGSSSSSSGGSSSVGESTSSTVAGPQLVGDVAPGNRLLMIGDSVLASTSRRYSNDMCNAVVPLGWRVELDAEVGRFIDFGTTVLDRRLKAGWDVGVIFLGSNYGDNIDVYSQILGEQVDRLSPNPVVLVTVTEIKPNRADVNAAIRAIAATHTNVTVLDWASISVATPGLLGGDGLHLSPSGRTALATSMAAVLGPAPTQATEPGECLTTNFRNDSAGNVSTGTTAPVRPPRITAPRTTRPTTRPTTKPVTTTTVGGGGSATTTTDKPSTGTSTPGTTAAPPPGTTAAPPTTSPVVRTTDAPPATQPPVTTPKPTSAPVTTQAPGPTAP